MSYTVPATSKTPALIIYLLDVSGSMNEPCGSTTKIEVVTDALHKIAVKMVQRSTKGSIVAPRYRVAMFAYSSQVIDLLGGVKTIDEVAKMGVPRLTTLDMTNTAEAFAEAEKLLQAELPNLQDCPAPLICHMTDGQYNQGGNPTPIAQRIMTMSVPGKPDAPGGLGDGDVLIENIYVSSVGLHVADVTNWPGVSTESGLTDDYAKDLFRMSSPIPDSYLSVMTEFGYKLNKPARMFFPGENPELVEIGFVMSGATPITRA